MSAVQMACEKIQAAGAAVCAGDHAQSLGERSRSTSAASSLPASGCTLYRQAMSGGADTMIDSTLQRRRGGGRVHKGCAHAGCARL